MSVVVVPLAPTGRDGVSASAREEFDAATFTSARNRARRSVPPREDHQSPLNTENRSSMADAEDERRIVEYASRHRSCGRAPWLAGRTLEFRGCG
jgi:hypothetical protein